MTAPTSLPTAPASAARPTAAASPGYGPSGRPAGTHAGYPAPGGHGAGYPAMQLALLGGARPAAPLARAAGGGTAATSAAGHALPAGRPGGPHAPATLDALLDSLRSEQKLVTDLAETMRRQRLAVSADDLQTVDDTVFATHRLLATLGQARLRRRQINRLLGGSDEIAMAELEAIVGAQMTDALRAGRDGLRASAATLAREVDVNRRVLRDALAHGDAHVRALAGAADVPTRMAGGILVDRSA
jgi:hypothetical protein